MRIIFQSINPESGHWKGYYTQGNSMYDFKVTVVFTKNKKVMGEGMDDIGAFSFNGDWSASTGKVKFVKEYHGRHSVNYDGKLSKDGKCIKGIYSLSGIPDDSFFMLTNTN